MSIFSELRELYRSRDKLPKARRIPQKFKTVSMDGWRYGDVALIPIKSFEPTEEAADLLQNSLGDMEGNHSYKELPVWLRVSRDDEAVAVMSGSDVVGTIAADPVYTPLLIRAYAAVKDLVADGTVLVKSERRGLKFKNLKIHVYKSLK
jgi:hypothetical protein